MKKIFFSGAFALLVTTLFSCSKDETTVPETGVAFAISRPTLNQSYQPGDTVRVQGTITYTSSLHGYSVVILNNDGDSLFRSGSHVHASTLQLDESWVNTQNSAQNLKVVISSSINHEGSKAVKEIPIRVQPK